MVIVAYGYGTWEDSSQCFSDYKDAFEYIKTKFPDDYDEIIAALTDSGVWRDTDPMGVTTWIAIHESTALPA